MHCAAISCSLRRGAFVSLILDGMRCSQHGTDVLLVDFARSRLPKSHGERRSERGHLHFASSRDGEADRGTLHSQRRPPRRVVCRLSSYAYTLTRRWRTSRCPRRSHSHRWLARGCHGALRDVHYAPPSVFALQSSGSGDSGSIGSCSTLPARRYFA